MGDMKQDSASRMGLTLQGYDQVIALSQANINQSLKRYFTIDHPEMTNFQAIIGGDEKEPDYSLIGKIEPPTIELIDADKADQAAYTIKFRKGATYSWFGPDPTNRRVNKMHQTSAEGWILSFFVQFALQKCAQMPVDLQNIVMKPGSYSVDQLVIVFGTADLMDFNWTRAKFPNMIDEAALLDAKTQMGKFVATWLTSLKSAETGKSHNVLGYSVKLDINNNQSRKELLEKIGDIPPSFPPIKVQFQTIANKPNANSAGDTKDPYNAFLFTEMCGIPENKEPRPLPQHDLQWSGNWFYGTIGGTMAMSSTIFLKEFVGGLVQGIHKSCTGYADKLAKRQTWDAEARIERVRDNVQFMGDWVHGQWIAQNENQWLLQSTSTSQHYEIPWKDSGKDFTVQANVSAMMETCLKPSPGTGNFDIEQCLRVVTKWSNHSEQYVFDATSIFRWTYPIQLAAVSTEGRLSSTFLPQRSDKPALTATITSRGRLVRGLGSSQTEEEREAWGRYESELLGTIENRMPINNDFTEEINKGLNGQKQFIFPGAGTFDISDPVFNNAGDLLLGLVYREGSN